MQGARPSVALGLVAALLLTTAAAAPAQGQSRASEIVLVASVPGGRANPTAHPVTLTVPLRDTGRYLGDLIVTIDPDDHVHVSAAGLFELLAQVVDEKKLAQVRAALPPSQAGLEAAGIALRYNATELALDVELSSSIRSIREIGVSNLTGDHFGEVIHPARVSAFLNLRGNFDYVYGDGGFRSPLFYLDGAARVGPIVAEGEGLWSTGGSDAGFVRAGSRLVYDDRDRLVRWTAGDLQPVARGFQSVPELVGLSVFRSYGVLEPERIARPRGDRSFVLTRPAAVEVLVNGQLVRRLQLTSGNYDLRDFPFTQGSNDVRLNILDDAGRSQVLNFNVFLDQNQLGRGLTEFGLYAGAIAATDSRGLHYGNDLAMSGFVRRGVTDQLTLGANLQADRGSQMGGLEAVWSSPIGTVGGTLAISNVRDGGAGNALLVTFQRLIKQDGGAGDSLNLFIEHRSASFGALGTTDPVNPFKWEAGGGYSRAIGHDIYASVDGRYSLGRNNQRNVYSVRSTLGWRLNSGLTIASEIRWERDNVNRGLSGLLTATMRLGRYSTVRADYDTRFDQTRLSYSTFRGYGVGSYNVTADVNHSDSGSGVNVNANYFANRAELGFSHFGSFSNLFGNSVSQQSTVRVATAVAFADGAVSVGRPIYDSFSIVSGHASLKGASIEVERTPYGFVAESGALGTALHPGLASYLNRTIALEAPDAPVTADLGQGTFRVFPPYRSGYRVIVGSAFNVTAIGRLVGADGEPLALVGGTLRQASAADTREVPIFTNRQGRFGAAGLAPGTWIARMNDDGNSVFELTISPGAEGVVTIGELRPTTGIKQGKP